MSDAGEDIATVFEELGDLEKDFAEAELDAGESLTRATHTYNTASQPRFPCLEDLH